MKTCTMKKCIILLLLCISGSLYTQEYSMKDIHPGVVYLKSDIRIYGRVDGRQYLLYQCKNCETTTGHPFYLNPEQLPDSIWFDVRFKPGSGGEEALLVVDEYVVSYQVKKYHYTKAYFVNCFPPELMEKLPIIIENGSRIFISKLIVTTQWGKKKDIGAYINSLAITLVDDYSNIPLSGDP